MSGIRYQGPRAFLILIPGGAIAQLGERLLCKQEVVGSIPSGSTRSVLPMGLVAFRSRLRAMWLCGQCGFAVRCRPLTPLLELLET